MALESKNTRDDRQILRHNTMTKEEKQKIENHIRDEIDVLKKDIESYEELTKPIPPDSSIGRLTRMDAINSKSINEAALSKAKSSLSGLEKTLEMLDDPDFGLCKECEEPIPFRRIMVMPGTEFCVECAEKLS
jgi:DnaK suppressor protein